METCNPWDVCTDGKRPLYIRWFISWLCNYRCAYCFNRSDETFRGIGSLLRHPRVALRAVLGLPAALAFGKRGRTPRQGPFQHDDHAFKHFPPEVWARAFDALAPARISMTITGGEPFLDKANFGHMLSLLTAMQHVQCLRIDTNGSWKAGDFPNLDWTKVLLNVSYHPTMIDLASFQESIRDKLDHGVRVGMVNYVLEPSQADGFRRVKDAFDALGIFTNANVYAGDECQSETAMALYHEFLPKFDVAMKLNHVMTLGKPCGYPQYAYDLDPAGSVHVGCFAKRCGNLIDGDLPERFAEDVRCPQKHCGCLDMYAFLRETGRARQLDLLAEYVAECRALHGPVAERPAP